LDYEEYYSSYKLKEKSIKESLKRQHTALNAMSRDAEKGDLKNFAKDLSNVKSLVSEYEGYLKEIRELTEGFDTKEYMQNGDFAKQMLTCCESQSLDVTGDYPVYEMFPLKVKIDGDNQDIYINNRRVPCARPQYLTADIKKNRDRLMRESFSANGFLSELAYAYDMFTLVKLNENKDGSHENKGGSHNNKLLLKDLYRYMAPMQRSRRAYDMQSYAFDLARLYSSDIEFTRDQRQFLFGTARYQSQNIRILDKSGKEAYVGTIEFIPNEDVSKTDGI